MNRGSPEASAAIWSWEDAGPLAGGSTGPSTASIRIRGVIQGVVTLGVAALFWYFDLPTMAMIAVGLAVIFSLASLLSPHRAYAAIQRGNARLGKWIGDLLNWILLPSIFYLFFLPFGKLFRRGRRDALKRFYESDAESYWIERSEAYTSTSRTKQF